jgi:hypothetical protein
MHPVTLPIDSADGLRMDPKGARALGSLLAEDSRSGFNGGGFHETSRGGKLGVHANLRIHEQLNVQRRINLLIYLNETWDDN